MANISVQSIIKGFVARKMPLQETLQCLARRIMRIVNRFRRRRETPPTIAPQDEAREQEAARSAAALQELSVALTKLSSHILRLSAPAFVPPSFQRDDSAPEDFAWPATYVMAAQSVMAAAILAPIGAVMREWAKAEYLFEAALRQMGRYPPAQGDPILDNLKLYSFSAKAEAWKRLQNVLFKDQAETLDLSKHIVSRAKHLSSIRNEFAHWAVYAVDNCRGTITLFDENLGSNPTTSRWATWGVESIEEIAKQVVFLQIALVAFTQHCFSLWPPALPDLPPELISNSGLRTLQSYRVQPAPWRPDRKPGMPT